MVMTQTKNSAYLKRIILLNNRGSSRQKCQSNTSRMGNDDEVFIPKMDWFSVMMVQHLLVSILRK